jgi:hypothetical protein
MHRIVFALLALALGACSTLQPRPDVPVRVDSLQAAPVVMDTDDDLAANRQRWQAQNVENYRFTYTRQCFCPPQARGPFEVTVRDGKVESVIYQGEGEPMERPLAEYQTVEDLFAVLADAYDRGAASVRASYDAETGQPSEFFIDYDEQQADEEVGFTVEPVRPLDG